MQRNVEPIRPGLDWLTNLGMSRVEVQSLNPCVPGEFMLDEALYVNSATPEVVYQGAGEGTLPLVTGRWFMISSSLARKYPQLQGATVPVARAPRLISGL